GGRVTIREENAIAALEVMSRFVADPHWIVYLPPTMSPCATSERDDYLEYPTEALGYYASHGVQKVVCQEKHMGSRAVTVTCRSSDTAAKRFRVGTGEQGIITTRTGRRFFDDPTVEAALVERIHQAAERSGLYEELKTDWLVLDMELMPWSAKAVGLLRDQYAPVGTAASSAAAAWKEVFSLVAARGVEGAEDLAREADRRVLSAAKFTDAYRRYCWQVSRLEDYKLAPFHLLASEGAVHIDKDHGWHLEMLGRLCDEDSEILKRTNHLIVNLNSEQDRHDACAWWETLVDAGGEGMVVKPWDFLVLDKGRPLQPAVKCRGPEYLRIIYGPEYLEPENLAQLRRRSVNRKRGLASREFVLGIEALERFVGYKSLTSVHECVFGVLALESEPVDPRL
ncbi:MAG TPA: hypothetical protein VJ835_10015, partial [Fimbriimonadaceae bacterium]|nr:hypothetical protein [Fimbriimonadaceae bacterium]